MSLASLSKEFVLLGLGGVLGWMGTMVIGNPSSTTQTMGFIAGAALSRATEFELEEMCSKSKVPDSTRYFYSFIVGVGAASMGIAAQAVASK